MTQSGESNVVHKRRPAQFILYVGLASFMAGVVSCDDPKPQASGSSAPSASAKPVVTAAPVAPPPASEAPVARVVKKKDPASCPKDGHVVFDDPNMETVVRRQLQKPSGTITTAELKKVKTLDISQSTSNDALDPCIFPYLTGLKGLYFAPGELDDISLLKGATQLNSLRIAATKVSDLSPLMGMHALDRLDMGRTPVRDLKPLADLTSLTELQLDETEVSDLSPLVKLDKLEVVLIKRTRISDVSPLKGMRKLKHLYIEGSLVQDTSPVLGITGLKVH